MFGDFNLQRNDLFHFATSTDQRHSDIAIVYAYGARCRWCSPIKDFCNNNNIINRNCEFIINWHTTSAYSYVHFNIYGYVGDMILGPHKRTHTHTSMCGSANLFTRLHSSLLRVWCGFIEGMNSEIVVWSYQRFLDNNATSLSLMAALMRQLNLIHVVMSYGRLSRWHCYGASSELNALSCSEFWHNSASLDVTTT